MTENELSFSTRRRVFLIQMIYSLDINQTNIQSLDEKNILSVVKNASVVSRYKIRDNLKEADLDIEILLQIVEKLSTLDEVILQKCKSHSLDRISKVVLSILRVGTYELKYAPHKHSIANIIRDYLNISIAFAGFVRVFPHPTSNKNTKIMFILLKI